MLHVIFSISAHLQHQKHGCKHNVDQAVQSQILRSPVAHAVSTCTYIFVVVHTSCGGTVHVAIVCTIASARSSHKTST